MHQFELSCWFRFKNMNVIGLNQQCRSIVAKEGESDRNRWLVGTTSVHSENNVYLVDYDEDADEITTMAFEHPGPVCALSSCTASNNWIFTCSNEIATLWNLNQIPSGQLVANNVHKLEKISTLTSKKVISNVIWEPNGNISKVLAYGKSSAGVYRLDSTLECQTNLSIPIENQIYTAKWNPHNEKLIAFGIGDCIYEWDIRTNQNTTKIENAHEINVRSLDYNQNKPFHLVSSGDDCMIRIWDTRNAKTPLMELSDHTHWIWNVSFNKYHDQLLLSCSSDCQVNLQSVVSVSSAPLHNNTVFSPSIQSEDIDVNHKKAMDGLISSFDQHEDSVYGVAWSPSDPWIFASLSFDGRIVVNFVPAEEKYNIIL
ncbi:hypothetical protein BC833DRAFT_603079 [Globomyces pollinis-pini]|nr:hypothetical protein BC833DRAFT_603079 [Globomyces pollinis-pini]